MFNNVNIYVIRSIIRKLKIKHIKSRSQKFRTKKYKDLSLYTGCSIVDIGEPQETKTTITYPVNIMYKANPEFINLNMVISRDEENENIEG